MSKALYSELLRLLDDDSSEPHEIALAAVRAFRDVIASLSPPRDLFSERGIIVIDIRQLQANVERPQVTVAYASEKQLRTVRGGQFDQTWQEIVDRLARSNPLTERLVAVFQANVVSIIPFPQHPPTA